MLLVLIPLVPALAMLHEYAGRNRKPAVAPTEPEVVGGKAAVDAAEKPVIV